MMAAPPPAKIGYASGNGVRHNTKVVVISCKLREPVQVRDYAALSSATDVVIDIAFKGENLVRIEDTVPICDTYGHLCAYRLRVSEAAGMRWLNIVVLGGGQPRRCNSDQIVELVQHI